MANRPILHQNSLPMPDRRPQGFQGRVSSLMRMYPQISKEVGTSRRAGNEVVAKSDFAADRIWAKKEVGMECCPTAEVQEPAGYETWRCIGESCCSGCSCYRLSERLGRSDLGDKSAG